MRRAFNLQSQSFNQCRPHYFIGTDSASEQLYVTKEALQIISDAGGKPTIAVFLGDAKAQCTSLTCGLFGINPKPPADYPGVYLWDHPLKMEGSDLNIFIAETVGYSKMSDSLRQKLFAVLFSVGTTMVFSSTVPFEDYALEAVSEVTSLKNWVEVYEENKQLSDLYVESIAPFIAWAMLKPANIMSNISGETPTLNQFFEQTLQSNAKVEPHLVNIKEQFINIFRRRSCLDLSTQEGTSAASSKVKELLLPTILAQTKAKRVEGVVFDAKLFTSFCLNVVDCINSKTFISFPSILDSSAAFELKELFSQAKLNYSTGIKTVFGVEKVYPKNQDLEDKLSNLRDTCLEVFNSSSHLAEVNPELYLSHASELDKFIEAREAAVRLKQTELKKKLGEDFIYRLESDVGTRWETNFYTNRNFKEFIENFDGHFKTFSASEFPESVNSRFSNILKSAVPNFLNKLESDYKSDRVTVDLLEEQKKDNKRQCLEEKSMLEGEKKKLEDEVTRIERESKDTVARNEALKAEIAKIKEQTSELKKKNLNENKINENLKIDEAKSNNLKKQKAHELEDLLTGKKK